MLHFAYDQTIQAEDEMDVSYTIRKLAEDYTYIIGIKISAS